MTRWTERREEWSLGENDARGPYDVDYGRVVHSSSFRRLQGKTQILNLGDSDFYRTRLTHSLEVAQIGAGLVLVLNKKYPKKKRHLPDRTLIHAICLVHDLGHPPFGHGGEVALNFCMRDGGGFEGNAQTLRILGRLEKFSSNAGANMTRRTLLGILKYPSKFSTLQAPVRPCLHDTTHSVSVINRALSKPPKSYFDCDDDIVQWMLEPLRQADRVRFQEFEGGVNKKAKYKSLDCSIMEIADDIAYGVHDLEDAIAMELIRYEDLQSEISLDLAKDFLRPYRKRAAYIDVYDKFLSELFGKDTAMRKRWISRLVGYFVTSVEIHEDNDFRSPLLQNIAKLPDRKKKLLKGLKNAVWKYVIASPRVQHLEFKGQSMVLSVFDAFISDPEAFLPSYAVPRLEGQRNTKRVVCDHIAGMTDLHLLRTYERLFSPRMGSVFDRL